MNPTITAKSHPSLFVQYPATRGDPRIGYSSIRNTPASIEAYVREVADPELVASIEHVAPALRERAWSAGYLLVNGRVQVHAEPIAAARGDRLFWNYEVAQVRGRVQTHSVCAYTSSPGAMLYCTCTDDAPATRIADHTCTHIIAYLLQEE